MVNYHNSSEWKNNTYYCTRDGIFDYTAPHIKIFATLFFPKSYYWYMWSAFQTSLNYPQNISTCNIIYITCILI
jgi:hypothetical protein